MTATLTPQARVRAAQATLDAHKGKRFKFGAQDCWQMLRGHLIRMGRPIKAGANIGPYHSLLGAQRKLKRAGYADLIAVMDAHFERIPPAAALPGDVIALPGQEGPGSLTVALGNGRVLGWHEDVPGAVVMQPRDYHSDARGHAAWRIA